MSEIEELFADIRNKLQPCKTVLEVVRSNKLPATNMITAALEDLEKVEKALGTYEDKIRRREA